MDEDCITAMAQYYRRTEKEVALKVQKVWFMQTMLIDFSVYA